MVAVEGLTATPGGHRRKSTLVRSSQKRLPRTIVTTPDCHRSQPTRAIRTEANQEDLPAVVSYAVHMKIVKELHADDLKKRQELHADNLKRRQGLHNDNIKCYLELLDNSRQKRNALHADHQEILQELRAKHQAEIALLHAGRKTIVRR